MINNSEFGFYAQRFLADTWQTRKQTAVSKMENLVIMVEYRFEAS